MRAWERHNESREDYLEAILRILLEKGVCRSVDVADKLEYSKPSVSVAMVNLREAGLVEMDEDKHISLTDAGRVIAEQVYRRHCYFKSKLLAIGVDPETAEHEACALEHAISEETFCKIETAEGSRAQVM